ncbi:IS5 family transposase [Methylorubrum thiocyanatum]
MIEPLLPTDVRGKERVDDRRVLNGIFWRLRTGAPWAHIPARYGPHTTCSNRFRRWRKRGIWDRLLNAVSKAYEGDLQMIDATSVRVHRHAACAQKRGRSGGMGRSRGGLTSKIHALVDAEGRPVALKITEGQAHDGRSAADMLGGLGTGQILLGDRAYDSDALRTRMAEQGAWANVKPMPNRKQVLAFSPFLYEYRSLVERFFSKIKHFRAVATRYDKDPDNFLASVKLAACGSGCEIYESAT